MRRLSPTDRFLSRLGDGLVASQPEAANPLGNRAVASPAAAAGNETLLDGTARRDAAGLMRVNHAGEVAAQGLYLGQALTARDPKIRDHLLAAAREEQTHLAWCEERLAELDDHPSRLRGFWYGASYAIGAVAGLFGDRWSLGFVAETESQVAAHLEDHLKRLPPDDGRSRAVVQAMRADETRHGREAQAKGGAPLPPPVKGLMRRFADVMKFAAYRF